MKKISYIAIIFLFLGFINNVMAARDNSTGWTSGGGSDGCSGLLINTSYNTINAPDNNIYGVGDTVETQLSFELDGEDGETVSPLSIVLVMDRSGSMGADMGGKMKIEVAKDSLENVANYIHGLNTPDVKMSLIYFSNSPLKVWPTWYGSGMLEPVNSSANYNSLITSINNTYASGGTYMGDAVHAALSIVNQGDPDSKKVIIVASDGISSDNVSSADQSILQSSVIGYAIGIGNSYNAYQLKTISAGDERFYDANNANQLDGALEDIMKDIIKFEASDLKVSFNLTDLANSNLSLLSASPNYSSISQDGKILTWNLGNKTDGYIQDIKLNFRVNSAIVGELPLNEDVLNFSYNAVDENGAALICSSDGGELSQPAIPVVKIFTHEIPTIVEFKSNPASGSNMYEGNPLTLTWKTENADKCVTWSNDGIPGWNNNNESASEGFETNKVVYPVSIASYWNEYWIQCQKTYNFGGGIPLKIVKSLPKQVQLRIDPCPPTPIYSCTRTSSEDELCAGASCGKTINLGNSDVQCIKTITYPTCSGKSSEAPTIEPVNICRNLPGGDICPPTYQCTNCKEVDKWIEVAP